MKKVWISFFVSAFFAQFAYAHCQVPCGIYDDHARVHLMQEHAQTIAKARNEIVRLKAEKKAHKRNDNQIVRWVMTKESHASDIQKIVNDYFLTQRVKLDWPDKKRNQSLNRLHKILVYAMKCKQSLDESVYSKLNQAINDFEQSYIGEHGKGKK